MTDSRPEGPRLFTIEEANALIPRLEVALSEMAAFRVELKSLRQEIEVLSLIAASASGSGNPDATELKAKRRRYRAVAAQIGKTGLALEDFGCLIKSPDEGLVDFFHLRDDRLVFLCWKSGEEQVEHWHPLSGGYATRKALGSQDA